jgi:hypothetical protein
VNGGSAGPPLTGVLSVRKNGGFEMQLMNPREVRLRLLAATWGLGARPRDLPGVVSAVFGRFHTSGTRIQKRTRV